MSKIKPKNKPHRVAKRLARKSRFNIKEWVIYHNYQGETMYFLREGIEEARTEEEITAMYGGA